MMQKYHQEVKRLINHEFTLYPTKEVNGRTRKGRAPAIVNHNVEGGTGTYVEKEYTGVTIHVIESHNGYHYAGVAIQMEEDQFNRKIGRNIAKGRAEQCLYYLLVMKDVSKVGYIVVNVGERSTECTILNYDLDRLVNHGLSNVPGVSVA